MEPLRSRRARWTAISLVLLFVAVLATIVLLAVTAEPDETPTRPTSTSTSPTSTSPSSGPGPTSGTSPPSTEPQDDSQTMVAVAVTRRTSTTRAARSRPPASAPSRATSTTVRTASSTSRKIGASAYCLRGGMANGRAVHDGAVASNVLPMGSRWRVLQGPLQGRIFEVEDTGGPRVTFDVWMASCRQAVVFGRPVLEIAPA